MSGAVLVDSTVRRPTGPWTPAVHALLRHLEGHGFHGVPRVLGIDEQGREMLTYLPGTTVGDARPWPKWVYSHDALGQVGRWLRRYHNAVTDFVPPSDAQWWPPRRWQPGDIIMHNDSGPYNAVWEEYPGADGRAGANTAAGDLIGFFDWDYAAPSSALRDLAFVAFSWVPLYARDVAAADGFADFADRPRRLRHFLDAYGHQGNIDTVLDAMKVEITARAAEFQQLAAAGDPLISLLVQEGGIADLDRALDQLTDDAASFRTTTT
ncbi:MAG: hypothetical protein ACRDS9_02560 [Pseudonocardiaceae bacterium]